MEFSSTWPPIETLPTKLYNVAVKLEEYTVLSVTTEVISKVVDVLRAVVSVGIRVD